MDQYDITLDVIHARHHIAVPEDTRAIRITAPELRKLGRGRAYIARDSQVMGIIRDGKFLATPSNYSAQPAEVYVGAPATDAERALLCSAAREYLRAHPGICGSAYDPAFAPKWAAYRADMQRIEDAA